MAFRAFLLSLLVLSAASPALQAQSLAAEVKTEAGLVSGSGDAIRAFKGIPFAAPPVGPLRWQPPQRAAPWSGRLDATRFGPDCIQPDEYPELRGSGKSEDCLTINVWTPAKS